MGVIQLRGAGGTTVTTEALDSGASEALFDTIATLAGDPLPLILADVEVARGIEARAEGFHELAFQWSARDLLDAGARLEPHSSDTDKEKSEPLHDRNQYIVTDELGKGTAVFQFSRSGEQLDGGD
jgi:hypothetical protein